MNRIAEELKVTLQTFNKGIKNVTVSSGIICVFVSSKRAANNVTIDLLRTHAFRSVVTTENGMTGKGFIVHAVPA